MAAATVILYQVARDVQSYLRDEVPNTVTLESVSNAEHLYLELQQSVRPAEALILGISSNEPVSIAQRVHSFGRDIPILILSEPERCEQLQQALQFSPFIGGDVQSLSMNVLDRLPSSLTRVVERTKKRRRYQGSIQAAQQRMEVMSRPPPPLTHYMDRVIDRAPVGIVNVDAKNLVLNVNRGACQILRIGEREAVGAPVFNLFSKREQDRVHELIAHCVAPLKRHRAETIRIKRSDGEVRHVEISVSSLIDRTGMLGCTMILQDVSAKISAESDRQRAEEDLKRSESQLRLITDTLPILISYIDVDHRYRFNNQAYVDWFSRPKEQLKGAHVSDVIGHQAYLKIKPYLDAALDGELVDFETLLPYVDRGERFVRGHITPDRSSNGEINGVVKTVSDITDIKRGEEREKQHLRELAHVSRVATLGEMSSQLAHELAQPLTAIANFTEASLRNLDTSNSTTDEDVFESLTDIASMADRAREIIKQLRSFVRKNELQRVPENVNDLVCDVLRLEKTEVRWHGLDLDVDLDSTLPFVMADKILIEQVILNLLRNAIESILNSGSNGNSLKIQTSRVGNLVQVAVSDTGPGLPEKARSRIFDPFFTTKETGLGMGLAISRSIVDAHGGRLWAENNSQRGATFRFTLATENRE